jgi:hypothetical protein
MNGNPPSLGSSVFSYAWMFVLISVLIGAVLWALETYAAITIEGASVGWIPAIVTAMQVGQRYGRLAGIRPSGGYAWAAGFGFMVVNIVLGLGGLAVAFTAMGGTMPSYDEALRQSGISQDDLPLFLGVVGGVLLLMWVLLRFGFSFGARQGIKIAQRTTKV